MLSAHRADPPVEAVSQAQKQRGVSALPRQGWKLCLLLLHAGKATSTLISRDPTASIPIQIVAMAVTMEQLSQRLKLLEDRIGDVPGVDPESGESSIGALMATWGNEFNSLEDRIHNLEEFSDQQLAVARQDVFQIAEQQLQPVRDAVSQLQKQLGINAAQAQKDFQEESPDAIPAKLRRSQPSQPGSELLSGPSNGVKAPVDPPQTATTQTTPSVEPDDRAAEECAQELVRRLGLGEAISETSVARLRNLFTRLGDAQQPPPSQLSKTLQQNRTFTLTAPSQDTVQSAAQIPRSNGHSVSPDVQQPSAKKRRLADVGLLSMESPRRTGREHKPLVRRDGMVTWREARDQGFGTGKGTAPWTPSKGRG